ncbi:hypothetical protein K3495_g13999 [Podosphaera aphanis]|nr:hypothetical protein K3495_g13999 [Podosphaera aphanis]
MIMATTKMGFNRGAGEVEDLYQPGTLREGTYLQSIPPGKLTKADLNEVRQLYHTASALTGKMLY